MAVCGEPWRHRYCGYFTIRWPDRPSSSIRVTSMKITITIETDHESVAATPSAALYPANEHPHYPAAFAPHMIYPADATQPFHIAAVPPGIMAKINPSTLTIPTTDIHMTPIAAGWSLASPVTWNGYIEYAEHGRNDRSPNISGQCPIWSPIPISFGSGTTKRLTRRTASGPLSN